MGALQSFPVYRGVRSDKHHLVFRQTSVAHLLCALCRYLAVHVDIKISNKTESLPSQGGALPRLGQHALTDGLRQKLVQNMNPTY